MLINESWPLNPLCLEAHLQLKLFEGLFSMLLLSKVKWSSLAKIKNKDISLQKELQPGKNRTALKYFLPRNICAGQSWPQMLSSENSKKPAQYRCCAHKDFIFSSQI